MRFRVAFPVWVLLGCNGRSGPGPAPAPLPLTLSSDALQFNSPIGVATTATITATNENASPVFVDAELDSLTSPEFAIQDTDCAQVLASGASCSTTVAFTPHRVGHTDGALALGGTFVSLEGIGEVALTISPTMRDFQTMYSDVDSDPFAFTIQNTTMVAQHPTTTLRNTLNYDGFAIASSTCTDITALGSCTITVVMKGGSDGLGRAAMLDVDGADASLTGTVSTILSPQLSVEGTGQVIGVGLHAPPEDLQLEIVNGTHTDLPNIDVAIAGADAAAFELASNGCAAPVADGAGCWLDVRAQSTGHAIAATLTAQTPNVPALIVSLSVDYQDDGPPIAIAPSGVVTFAPDQTIPFTVSDPSSTARFIDTVTVAAPYQISNDACHAMQVSSVNPCTFAVTRVGSSAGDPNQVLTIGWNEGQQTTVTLAPAN
jgi:hypothetical protein